MKIGIAAATSFEIESTINFLSGPVKQHGHEFEILITGIGCLAATYQLTSFIRNKSPQYMIQAGIGGSFNATFELGRTFLIVDDIIGDMGVEENNLFKDLFDMGFMDENNFPFSGKRLVNPGSRGWESLGLPTAHGVTVNQITTDTNRIIELRKTYQCDIESMEGAAFHYVCLQENIPFLQLRSVSNTIGERDKKQWRLRESVLNLNEALIKIIQQIP